MLISARSIEESVSHPSALTATDHCELINNRNVQTVGKSMIEEEALRSSKQQLGDRRTADQRPTAAPSTVSRPTKDLHRTSGPRVDQRAEGGPQGHLPRSTCNGALAIHGAVEVMQGRRGASDAWPSFYGDGGQRGHGGRAEGQGCRHPAIDALPAHKHPRKGPAQTPVVSRTTTPGICMLRV